MKVRGLISKLPEYIELNIEKIAIGKNISAGDIKIDGITLLHPSNISVVSVDVTRAVTPEAVVSVATPAAAATPAAPAAKAPAKNNKIFSIKILQLLLKDFFLFNYFKLKYSVAIKAISFP